MYSVFYYYDYYFIIGYQFRPQKYIIKPMFTKKKL